MQCFPNLSHQYFWFFLALMTIGKEHQGKSLIQISEIENQSFRYVLGKGVLNICSKFNGEHPSRSGISVKLQSNFIEITLRHGCSPGNLLHIFRTLFPKNTSQWLLLEILQGIKNVAQTSGVCKVSPSEVASKKNRKK